MACDSTRFEAYCRQKEAAACAARLAGFRTIQDCASSAGLLQVGNEWTCDLFDGPFYVRQPVVPGLPATSLVFVQSRDGDTVADDPSALGGGDTDKHLIYEGLSRVAADAVLAGASTARIDELVFSVWHPQLVALRRACGKPRHPAQVVVTGSGNLPFECGLMFTTPQLRVFVVARSGIVGTVLARVGDRPWIDVVDAGEPMSMTAAVQQLNARGLRVISAVGGRGTAMALMREGLVGDLYLTTSAISAGEPNTPLHDGTPLRGECLLEKAGRGEERGVRFEHLRIER